MITNSYEVVEDNFEVAQEFGPFVLRFGEAFTAINLSEMGEIESIELVTDNPYAALYLELDDFRPYSRGVTASELINRGRDKPNHKAFYAEDRTENGEYVIKYSPKRKHGYDSKIKIEVRNDIPLPDNFVRRPLFEYRSKGDLPNPTTLSFAAGSVLNISKDGQALSTEDFSAQNSLAAFDSRQGASSFDHFNGVEQYSMPLTNDLFRKTPLSKAGYMHPYVGFAGKVEHQSAAESMQGRLVLGTSGVTAIASFGEPGDIPLSDGAGNDLTAINGFFGANDVTDKSWPGDPVSRTFSQQVIMLYADATKDITVGFTEVDGNTKLKALLYAQTDAGLGNNIYFKSGNTIYYPGRIVSTIQYLPAAHNPIGDGNPAFGDYFGASGNPQWDDLGGVAIVVEPGLNFKPKDIVIETFPTRALEADPNATVLSGIGDFGIVGAAQMTESFDSGMYLDQSAIDGFDDPDIGIPRKPKGLIVKKLTVKRRRKVSVI